MLKITLDSYFKDSFLVDEASRSGLIIDPFLYRKRTSRVIFPITSSMSTLELVKLKNTKDTFYFGLIADRHNFPLCMILYSSKMESSLYCLIHFF
jgi:hypothetical protein